MGNLKSVMTIVAMFLISLQTIAQVPQKFNYQTVCRDTVGNILVNKPVNFRLSIHDLSPTGTIVYQETHDKYTNSHGLVTVEIGNGDVQIGTFSSITWHIGEKYFEVEIDMGMGYISVGISQLISVPYALHAKTAENLSNGISEVDPVFISSPAYEITNSDIDNWNNKLDYEVDGSVTNEIQYLSLSNDTLYLSHSGFVVLPVITDSNHYIGELFGGGIVVALWKESGIQKGLIASLVDISSGAVWSNVSSALIGATAQSPSDGQANTNAIISQVGHTSSAAKLCDNYNGGGFNDWYLPSIWELNQCYNVAFIINNVLGDTNGFQFSNYWSSTENENNTAWSQAFTNGIIYSNSKMINSIRIRAVRRF